MEKVFCKLCNKEFVNTAGLSNHVNLYHVHRNDIESVQTYYDIYLMIDPNEKKCENCGKETVFKSFKRGYSRHCSWECSQKNPIARKFKYEKTKEALIKKYGVHNPGMMDGYHDKVKKTKKEKYGDENYNNSEKNKKTNLKNHGGKFSTGTDEYKEKYKKTVLEKYGVEHHTQSSEVKKKNKKTCLERYGVEWAQQNKEIKQKGIDTCFERYGGILYGSEIQTEKIKKTNLKKYGCEHPQQNKEIRAKSEKTNIEKYGMYYTLQNKNILQKLYGVDDINQLDWVVQKQKECRTKTLKEKYQVENISQLQWVQEIIKKTVLEKYGVEHVFQSNEIKEKSKITSLLKYGVEYPMQSKEIFNKCLDAQKGVYRIRKYELKDGRIIRYQSLMELAFIEYCEDNNIWIDNGDKVPYLDNNGKKHVYFVDFKIKEDDKFRLVEIKGTNSFYYHSLENGILLNKVLAAQVYSEENGYLPFKLEINYTYE